MNVKSITHEGRDCVLLNRSDFEDIIDARDHAIAMRNVAAGAVPLSSEELDVFLAAPTPLAFWRKRAGKTQVTLATEVGISQAFLAQIEGGKREGGVKVLQSLARALHLRLEDLVE